MSDIALSLTGLEKAYNRGQPGEVVVLKGADLDLAKGEVVALVAPSGAGKSTLLHIAGLLDMADSGTVRIGGQEATGMSDRRRTNTRRREVGFIYQFHHLLPEFSALENVVLPQLANGTGAGEAEARANALLAKVGVGDRADHRPAALSGGEQQRVAFCRALANAPGLLLADEPTGNLDPATSVGIMRILDRINRTGTTVVMATHDHAIVDAMRRRVVQLERGRVVRDQSRGVYERRTEPASGPPLPPSEEPVVTPPPPEPEIAKVEDAAPTEEFKAWSESGGEAS